MQAEAVFSMDAVREALEPPRTVLYGETYTGRVLGFQEVLTMRHEMATIEAESDQVAFDKVVELIQRVIPDVPREKLLKQPLPVLVKALNHFFEYLSRQQVEGSLPTTGSS